MDMPTDSKNETETLDISGYLFDAKFELEEHEEDLKPFIVKLELEDEKDIEFQCVPNDNELDTKEFFYDDSAEVNCSPAKDPLSSDIKQESEAKHTIKTENEVTKHTIKTENEVKELLHYEVELKTNKIKLEDIKEPIEVPKNDNARKSGRKIKKKIFEDCIQGKEVNQLLGNNMRLLCKSGNDAKLPCKSGNDTKLPCKSGNDTKLPCKSGNDTKLPCKSGNDTKLCKSGNDSKLTCKSSNDTKLACKSGNDTELLSKSGNDKKLLCKNGNKTELLCKSGNNSRLLCNCLELFCNQKMKSSVLQVGKVKHRKNCRFMNPNTVCSICGRFFDRISNLKRHMLTHSGNAKYCCKKCNFKALDPSNLARHMNIHLKVYPFKCDRCSYKCVQSYSLERHIRSKHTKFKPFCCNECGYKCSRRDMLSSHMKMNHLNKTN